jgi:hypothetical protein
MGYLIINHNNECASILKDKDDDSKGISTSVEKRRYMISNKNKGYDQIR